MEVVVIRFEEARKVVIEPGLDAVPNALLPAVVKVPAEPLTLVWRMESLEVEKEVVEAPPVE